MKDRITEFLTKENISPAEFADKIGVQRSSVSHVLNGRNYPGASFLQKMLSSYKSLNPRWLLLGEGPMLEFKKSIAEPSLFSFSAVQETAPSKSLFENASEIRPKEESETILEKTQIKTETIFPKSPISETKEEINQKVNEIFNTKEVEKIVMFYSDKTFSVYTPTK
jgi:transcriptional regulator with XRE-family HTH domain